jgi:hypothetical protein
MRRHRRSKQQEKKIKDAKQLSITFGTILLVLGFALASVVKAVEGAPRNRGFMA